MISAVEPEDRAAVSHPTFEDRAEEIWQLIENRRGTMDIAGMEWKDVRQLVLIRVHEQYDKFSPADGEFAHWLNRLISNSLSNIWRDNGGSLIRPCIKGKLGCPSNCGGDLCSATPSGLQCAECPLYRKWEKFKGSKYAIKFPIPLETKDPTTGHETTHPEATVASFLDVEGSTFDGSAAQRAISRLAKDDQRFVRNLIRRPLPTAQTRQMGISKKENDRLVGMRPLLARYYVEELNDTRTRSLKFMKENKLTITIEDGVEMPPRFAPQPKYPYAELEVGQSFFAPVLSARLSKSSEYYRKKGGGDGKTFTVRKAEKDGIQGARVWRLT